MPRITASIERIDAAPKGILDIVAITASDIGGGAGKLSPRAEATARRIARATPRDREV
jgi:hypothetical protein